jgi:two-component system, OmpR family, sensor kinase
MASLRARLIAGLLVVAAAGLVLLAAITYAEQRSFLLDRVDQQARSAAPAVSHALNDQGVANPGARERRPDGDERPPPSRGGGGDRGGAAANLPPGTYGERRSASGKVLGHVVLSYGETAPAAPDLPARLPVDKLITVPAKGDSGLRYRVVATPDPFSSNTTVTAVPLREVDQTLSRLALVEALVIGAILLALGALAFFVVRLGLRPLDRMADTAGAIAAGDLSRRVSPATPRTEVGRLGLALNSMLERLEEAFAERQASEDRLRRFLADASHELRTPLVSIRG